MGELTKRLVELDEILSFLPYEDLLKIPEEIWHAIQAQKDETYVWKYDESVSLKEQNVHRDTILMLSYINIKYLLNEEEKNYVEKVLEFNESQKTMNQSTTINSKNIVVEENNEISEEIIEYKENFFVRFINRIKSWFAKK